MATKRFIRMSKVPEKIGRSRATIYELMDEKSPRHDPDFPKLVRLGLRTVGFFEDELDAYMDKKAQQVTAPANPNLNPLLRAQQKKYWEDVRAGTRPHPRNKVNKRSER